MTQRLALLTLVMIPSASMFPQAVQAAEHRVEVLNEAAPEDGLSAEIRATLQPQAVRVIRGTSRTIYDIWLCKSWELKSAKPVGDVNYPFVPGQLIGVIRFPRKASDFRDQDIAAGTYTLRYAQQPVDGAHVGTSPTRDFLLLVSASKDSATEKLAYESLTKQSSASIETSHPAMLSLQPLSGDATIRHEEGKDWWMVRLNGQAATADGNAPLGLELVVVGIATE